MLCAEHCRKHYIFLRIYYVFTQKFRSKIFLTLSAPDPLSPVLDRRRQRSNWRLATDLLPSTDHVCGTVYRRPFATRHWHSLFSATDSRPICFDSSCGVCDFEQTPSNVL